MISFSQLDLPTRSIRLLADQGIIHPTPIQELTIPLLLDCRDVIGQARTGSGKTLAFGLPLLDFVEPKSRAVQALVLTPTRELANQIVEVLTPLAALDRINVLPIYGGRSMIPQISALKRGVQVVVATPGRLVDLLNRKAISLSEVRYAVIDEADEMLDQGFARDVEKILKVLKHDHVTALFSATMPDWVHQASRKYMHNPEVVRVEPEAKDEPKIEHVLLEVEQARRMDALCDLLNRAEDGSSIVFGRTKHGVKKLAKKLDSMGYSVGCLQGNMSQNARDRAVQSFREKEIEILVATNVAARGLDIDHVELVVNYELPESPELLTHRVGRTGRMGREGFAYTLVSEEDQTKWRKLKRAITQPLKTVSWPEFGRASSSPRTERVTRNEGRRPPRNKSQRPSASRPSPSSDGSARLAGNPGSRNRRRRPTSTR